MLSSTDTTALLQLAGTYKVTHVVTVVTLQRVVHKLDSGKKVPTE